MSAFLGPIHYWLYNKIQHQQSLVDQVIAFGEEKYHLSLEEQCNEKYGLTERRNLEEVIDESNIHGWLQIQVSRVEYKLAYCVTELLKQEGMELEKLQAIFYKQGVEKRQVLEKGLNIAQLFKVIQDTLLNGMPCDHAEVVVEQDENCIVWQRRVCVHQKYWDEVGGNVHNYYGLIEAWLTGFVEEGQESFIKENEITYKMKA
ncbi:MAG: hypothetical protein H9893_03815 [Candidatus Niameybacter stercoravium]|nr:hypothetical protein [Candidatus Niameybacter stercoravium]